MHPLREFLLQIGAHLQSDAMTHRVMGHLPWGAEMVEYVDLRPAVRIDPPASPAQIAGLERDVPLPASVREVLSEVSAYIEIRMKVAPLGQYSDMGWDGVNVGLCAPMRDRSNRSRYCH
ncbi:hypothetical protein V8J82_23470 [Gymnodinialimonas sp. 2305UL16-5]|uniref:hypothetical protein n=1 Tax=Gymnodinialimonas mytili TaxID=3126503 RepID=UPI0030A20B45